MQEAYVQGVSTRRVDDLVQALGIAGISKNEVRSPQATSWTPNLSGFGHAVAIDTSRLTQAGTMVATVSYMPPEQALGGEITARCDLYSVSCMALRDGHRSTTVCRRRQRGETPKVGTRPRVVCGLEKAQELGARTLRPYCSKFRSKVKASPIRSRSMTAKAAASVKENRLSAY